MSDFTFVPMGGRPHTFEVYNDGASIGFVWKLDSVWYGDPIKMEDPKVVSTDREAAARALARAIEDEA